MEQLIINLIIIQATAYFITSDKEIPETIRYYIFKQFNRLPKKPILKFYRKEITMVEDCVAEEWVVHKVTLGKFIETIINCGYCLTFWITFIVLLVNGYSLYGFFLALVNAFCYKILNV